MTYSIPTTTKMQKCIFNLTTPAKDQSEIAVSFDPSRIKIKSQAICTFRLRIKMTTLIEPSKLMEIRRINPRARLTLSLLKSQCFSPVTTLLKRLNRLHCWKNQSTSISTGGRGLEHEHRIDHVAAHVRHHFEEHVVALVLVFNQGIFLAIATQTD